MKIRIGIRNNLFYPLNLIIFIFLRRIIEMLISLIYGNTGLYLYPAIIFASKFIFGLIVFSYSGYFIKSIKLRKIMGMNLIQAKNEISKADSSLKIFILIFFASYFDFIGSIARKSLDQKEDIIFHSLGQKLRSFQIIISALLCYFTIRTKIYRHNLFSLIVIFFCLILIISIEIISIKIFEKNYKKLLYIGKTLISGFGRAFLDTIEKYLFEFDYLSPFKVMAIEGILDIFLLIIYFFIQRDKIDKCFIKKFEIYILFFIFLFILFFIFSGL